MHGDDLPLNDLAMELQRCISKVWELSAKVSALEADMLDVKERQTAIGEPIEDGRKH